MARKKDEDTLMLSALKTILDERLGPILEDRLKVIHNESLDERLEEIKEIKKEVDNLKERMANHEKKSEDSDKYSRCNNLVFHRIPYQTNEDPQQKALNIIQGVIIDIEVCNLDAAHRLRTKNTSSPPPFINRLVNRWKKEDILVEFRRQQPRANRWGRDKGIRIFCNEQLTPHNQLLSEAKKWSEFYTI